MAQPKAAPTDTSTFSEVTLAISLLLLCAGSTAYSRLGGFSGPEDGLDQAGREHAARVSLPARFAQNVSCGSTPSAIETTEALGIGALIEPALADLDHGRWTGRTFEEIEADEPGAFLNWLRDLENGQDTTIEGAETLEALTRRVGPWIDHIAASGTPACGVSHAMPIRAALAHALGLPIAATLAIDIAPLSHVLLSFNGKWRLQSLGNISAIAN